MLNKTAIAIFLSAACLFALTSCNSYDNGMGTGNGGAANNGTTNNSTDLGTVNGGVNTNRGNADGGTGSGTSVDNGANGFMGDVEDDVMGYTNYR